ncbi:MAG: 16S rRNA (guanine(966)-N(2))-methyltransferase RsmD [Planctomycetota bacterium]
MRVIGGQNRGLKLATPKGREVRPILGRVRESLFGILRNDVPEANVADLFAGTGVIGLEALSRGATSCVFIERDATCIATIKENIRRARLEDRCRVVRGDVFRSDDQLAELDPFGLVFVDPPYRMLRGPRNHSKVESLVARLGEPDILAGGGTLVLRFPSDADIPGHVGPLTQTDCRRYGGMKIALFKKK